MNTGDPLNLQIETTGHPAPSVTWGLNDEDIDDEKITTKVEGRKSSLMIPRIERKHGGRYTAIAEIIAGRDQIDIDVKIVGKITEKNTNIYTKPPKCVDIIRHTS